MDDITPHRQQGDLLQYDRPNWDPLVLAVGEDVAGWFMWMHEIELDDGTPLQAYKHETTRRYLHLSAEGHAYWFSASARRGGRSHYTPLPLSTALEDTLETWWDSPIADPPSIVHARAAVERARARDAELATRDTGGSHA